MFMKGRVLQSPGFGWGKTSRCGGEEGIRRINTREREGLLEGIQEKKERSNITRTRS